MLRGEVWTLRDKAYAAKARPVIVVQDETVASFDSIILCLLTTFDMKDAPTRVRIDPDENNGLMKTSYAMTDKIVTVDKKMLGERVGTIETTQMNAISTQLARLLGIT
ncbi:type II toxin-antitoxin system PemK/MazF family toxin [Actinomyces slackii]|uniref:mRNA interferase MazF4 n=1 Tax=Actinomyces slackii TaxID=52774 RepID=A0A3S4SRE2_9ACTO|nr:type II toxin-antitoxin system PemK/MazF family toxin [Actinomyces slackii]VEG75951.1 mRNA interferase MazF4 [Actinomyces slackii]